MMKSKIREGDDVMVGGQMFYVEGFLVTEGQPLRVVCTAWYTGESYLLKESEILEEWTVV